jgi:hypothetical protein
VTASPSLANTSSVTSQNTSTAAASTQSVATCSNPLACQASAACSPDHNCLCQPSVDGVGYCLTDTPCSKLRNCTTNTDCGARSTCMATCCATHKCLDQPFFCPNPGTPIRLFARRELLDRDIPTTNGIHQKRRWNNPRPGGLDCQPDNCLRETQDSRFSSLASDFCTTYTTTVNTEPTAIPAYLENCSQKPTAVSSACSCLVGPETSTSSSVCTPLPTQTPLDCQPNNCFREISDVRFSSLAVNFCATYTTAVVTDPSAIPTYLENCSASPSAVGSACPCLITPATSNVCTLTSTQTPTPTSTPVPTNAPLDCQPDNCLREITDNRFSSLAINFCSTYTTAEVTEPGAIPAYLGNCAGNPSAVSSTCSCLVAPTARSPVMKRPERDGSTRRGKGFGQGNRHDNSVDGSMAARNSVKSSSSLSLSRGLLNGILIFG